uniref:Saposin B-type domain-containing protein n=1 Tax=Panagrolaimus sp. PS1159 TaxID=55785 RepID=A0AC35FCM4_9BILA
MKVAIFLALFCFVGAFAYKDAYLKSNKTPKKALQFTSVCDECQDIVKRFAEAARSPAKMATLKELLSLMCEETKHVTECRVIVSKLDLFIEKLLPYLKDPEAICHRFRMCSNTKLEQFHRVGLLFAKKYLNEIDGAHDLICEECQFAAHELQQVVDDRSTQASVRSFISNNICSRLGQYRGSCDIVLDDFLPDLFQELHNMLQDSKQFCVDLKLCTRKQVGISMKPVSVEEVKSSFKGPGRLSQFKKELHMLSSKKHPEVLMSCLECKIAIDALLIEMRTDKSVNGLATDIINDVCPKLPTNFNASCHDFLGMYGPTVVNMTLYQFTAEDVCVSVLHSCPKPDSFAAIAKLSYVEREEAVCEACHGISKFIDAELSDAVIKQELIEGLRQLICSKAPQSAYNLCSNLAKGYLPLALDRIERFIGEGKLCKKAHAC